VLDNIFVWGVETAYSIRLMKGLQSIGSVALGHGQRRLFWGLGLGFGFVIIIITTFTTLDILPRRDVSAHFGGIGMGMGLGIWRLEGRSAVFSSSDLSFWRDGVYNTMRCLLMDTIIFPHFSMMDAFFL
jgi:hypothetical protein